MEILPLKCWAKSEATMVNKSLLRERQLPFHGTFRTWSDVRLASVSVVTPDDHESESAAELAAEKLIRKL